MRRSPRRGHAGTELLRLAQRLTDRDRYILSLVEQHRVLTTPQITQACFDHQHTAAQRLRVLAGLGLLARFRPRLDRGSAPWHYVLDSYGAMVLAVERGQDADQHRVRRDRQLALASSSQLGHRLGAAGFFTALIAHARRSEGTAELVDSHNEAALDDWVSSLGCRSMVRPDGGGHWREHGRATVFVLEWDTGTEPHRRLQSKLERYAAFYAELRSLIAGGWNETVPWVLFSFPGHQRELQARKALSAYPGARDVPVATTCLVGDQNPAERVWSVLRDGVAFRRRLGELATPGQEAPDAEGERPRR